MEEAQEMKEKGVVQDWTVIVEGFLLFPVCLAGFLLNIVRWPGQSLYLIRLLL